MWVQVGSEDMTSRRRHCVFPGDQVSCGERETYSPGCVQEVREVPSWLPAQLEPNKAGL